MKRHVWLVVCGLVLPTCLFNSSRTIGGQTSSPPYEDPSLPIEKRADDMISRMTLEEKVSQMMNAAHAIPRLDIPAYRDPDSGGQIGTRVSSSQALNARFKITGDVFLVK